MEDNKNKKLLKFNKIIDEQIQPLLIKHEEYRKKELKKFILPLCLSAFLIVLFLISIFILASDSLNDDVLIVVAIIAFVLGVVSLFKTIPIASKISNKNNNFVKLLKKEALEEILKVFFKNIEWLTHSSAGITDEELDTSGLFIPFNHRKTDDEFKGCWKGVAYRISETNMWDEHGSGKNRSAIPVFRGIVISFKCNKNIKNRTIVATKGDWTRKSTVFTSMLMTALPGLQCFKHGFDIVSLIFFIGLLVIGFLIGCSMMKKEEPLNKVTLEDPLFNKRFNVYSSDQVEARYLLTTAFMERFYNLKTAFKAKNIKCSFFGDNLMIAIQTRENLFEVGNLFHSLLKSQSHKKLFNDINSILQMIEYFKLDENTGL